MKYVLFTTIIVQPNVNYKSRVTIIHIIYIYIYIYILNNIYIPICHLTSLTSPSCVGYSIVSLLTNVKLSTKIQNTIVCT